MPKPPLPSPFVSRKSESFRGVSYSPPGEVDPVATQQPETTTGIRSFIQSFWSGSGSLPAHARSDSVVDELARRNSSGGGKRNDAELPPKATRTSSTPPAAVGLPSVTLVATEAPPSKETETSEMNADTTSERTAVHQQSSIQKESVLENKKEEKQTLTTEKGPSSN